MWSTPAEGAEEVSEPTLRTILSQEEAQRLAEAVLARVGAREALVEIEAEQTAKVEFARNELLHMDGAAEVKLSLILAIDGKRARVETHDLSEASLARLVEQAEDLASRRISAGSPDLLPEAAEVEIPSHLYAEATAEGADPTAQAQIIQRIMRGSKDAELISAGALLHETGAKLIRSAAGYGGYSRSSYSEFSLSARTASGAGAGWAWGGGEDADRIDPLAIAARAQDLAQRSENPVAIEPGRYTVILEPEALAQMLDLSIRWTTMYMDPSAAEHRGNVYSRPGGGTRVGEQMADSRVQFFYDPQYPLLPFSPLDGAALMKRNSWLRDGVLENLAYDAEYARARDLPVIPNPLRAALSVDAAPQTLEQMIASTRRGVWVHRFSGLNIVDFETLLMTGVTRDGTFLIENGEISKPIRNLRFIESPFFILNKLEAAGETTRAHRMIACPRLKIHDFEFSSLSDAI